MSTANERPQGYGWKGCQFCSGIDKDGKKKKIFKIETIRICPECLKTKCIGITVAKNGKQLKTRVCNFPKKVLDKEK